MIAHALIETLLFCNHNYQYCLHLTSHDLDAVFDWLILLFSQIE